MYVYTYCIYNIRNCIRYYTLYGLHLIESNKNLPKLHTSPISVYVCVLYI